MYDEHTDYDDRPAKSRRPSEIKSWFVCAMFGMAVGFGAAASLGDAVEAGREFLAGPERTSSERQRAFGDGLFDDRTAIPRGAPAARRAAGVAGIPATIGPRGVFPGAAVQAPASEDAEELAPGARLVLRGRVELASPAQGGR